MDYYEITHSESFKKWFGNWEEAYAVAGLDFKNPIWKNVSKAVNGIGQPLRLYHGTTHEWTKYSRKLGNHENDMGIGFYATSDIYDAQQNYLKEGKDITSKVSHFAEELANKEGITTKKAHKIIKSKYVGDTEKIMEVFLKLKRPVIISTKGFEGTNFDFAPNFDVSNDIYEDAKDLVKFKEAFDDTCDDFDLSYEVKNRSWGEFMDNIGELDYVSAYNVIKAIKRIEYLFEYLYNEEIGGNNVYEFVSQIFQKLRFDGVIYMDASEHFINMDIPKGTKHLVAFKPNQIKLATGENTTFSTRNDDIRFDGGGGVGENIDFGDGWKGEVSRNTTTKKSGIMNKLFASKLNQNTKEEDIWFVHYSIKDGIVTINNSRLRRNINVGEENEDILFEKFKDVSEVPTPLTEYINSNKKENGGDIRFDDGGYIEKVTKAINDIDFTHRALMTPYLDERISGTPNSTTTTITKESFSDGTKADIQNIFSFDSNGKINGRMSIYLTKPVGVFDIIVRGDARKQGIVYKMLDRAEELGIDIVENIKKNDFTEDGKAMVKKWLENKLKYNNDIGFYNGGKVFYHGTGEVKKVTDAIKNKTFVFHKSAGVDDGIYLTKNKELAYKYADLTSGNDKGVVGLYFTIEPNLKIYKSAGEHYDEEKSLSPFNPKEATLLLQNKLILNGYDGIKTGDVIMIFPQKMDIIKVYDSNPDIRFKDGGGVNDVGIFNNIGGYNYIESDNKIAEKVDLITLPKTVEGTNCSNCMFIKILDAEKGLGFCKHKDIQLPVTARMCCAMWDNAEALRSWENKMDDGGDIKGKKIGSFSDSDIEVSTYEKNNLFSVYENDIKISPDFTDKQQMRSFIQGIENGYKSSFSPTLVKGKYHLVKVNDKIMLRTDRLDVANAYIIGYNKSKELYPIINKEKFYDGGGIGFGEVLKIKDIDNIKQGDVLGFVYKEEGKTTVRDTGKADFFDEGDKWRGFDIDGYPFEFEDKKELIENKNNPEFELKDIENSGTYWTLYHLKDKKSMDDGGDIKITNEKISELTEIVKQKKLKRLNKELENAQYNGNVQKIEETQTEISETNN